MAGTNTSPRKPQSIIPWGRETMTNLRDEVEGLLSRLWEDEPDGWFSAGLKPPVDLSETNNSVEVHMDLPGIKADEIDIQIKNGLLVVSGERKEEQEEKGRTYHRVECRKGSFSRTFTLPCAVTEDEVVAECSDGVLNITLPKTEESLAHKVKVKG